ncbi:hypothetical protein [Pseudofrankia sp. BMG5.36]|uniref:hypothetical protein n=2 Tax=unclassified Pseudofrankia TaxID=2994372 RepID=UPI0012FF623F|nr:hypothetical protein [Pseudofrankia sp. BMG5.36]
MGHDGTVITLAQITRRITGQEQYPLRADVLPELAREIAENVARLVPRSNRPRRDEAS